MNKTSIHIGSNCTYFQVQKYYYKEILLYTPTTQTSKIERFRLKAKGGISNIGSLLSQNVTWFHLAVGDHFVTYRTKK